MDDRRGDSRRLSRSRTCKEHPMEVDEPRLAGTSHRSRALAVAIRAARSRLGRLARGDCGATWRELSRLAFAGGFFDAAVGAEARRGHYGSHAIAWQARLAQRFQSESARGHTEAD